MKKFPHSLSLAILFSLFWFFPGITQAQWLDFEIETNQWFPDSLDGEEKDLVVADFNNDGLSDLVVVRKVPFSNMGAEPDKLFINSGSSLEDMTATFAPGFNENPTDARDVFAGDFDNDGWTDLVIANTFEDQPRYYRNMGDSTNGDWLGLVDESDERFPLPLDITPLQFCALWAGDVTGNGALDIYFSNYNPNNGSEDVLLINDGNGFFTDESDDRLGVLRNSAFGTSVEIHDMDNDGDQDIVKISTLYGVNPWFDNGVFLLFNDSTGYFTNWQKIPSNAPYMFTILDLNQDGQLDVYVVDDNQDYYNLSDSIIIDSFISFDQNTIMNPKSANFGGNVKFTDLDKDGDLDMGLADVDVDIPPCESGINSSRKFTLMETVNGGLTAPYGSMVMPWNVSTYDFAFIDLDNDCFDDIVLGRCDKYEVFMNQSSRSVDIIGDSLFCVGDSVMLAVDPGYVNFLWSTGDTTATTQVLDSGLATVTVVDSFGCTATDSLIVDDLGDVTISGDSSFCEGDTITLLVTSNYVSYLWSTGDTIASTQVSESGWVTAVVVDSFGCTVIDSFLVDEVPGQEMTIVVQLCEPGNVLIGDEVVFFDSSGTYIFVLEGDLPHCDTTVTVDVLIDPVVLSDTLVTPDNGGNNGTIQVVVGGGTPPYNLLWLPNGETTDSIGNLMAGTYTLVITDVAGCTDSFIIEVPFISSTNRLTSDIEVQIMPNPFSGAFSITLKGATREETVIRLFSLGGQLCYETTFFGNDHVVDIPLLPGCYLVEVRRENLLISRNLLLKQSE